jgi:hypothetical protein
MLVTPERPPVSSSSLQQGPALPSRHPGIFAQETVAQREAILYIASQVMFSLTAVRKSTLCLQLRGSAAAPP